jgi:hypothetical protein
LREKQNHFETTFAEGMDTWALSAPLVYARRLLSLQWVTAYFFTLATPVNGRDLKSENSVERKTKIISKLHFPEEVWMLWHLWHRPSKYRTDRSLHPAIDDFPPSWKPSPDHSLSLLLLAAFPLKSSTVRVRN